MGQTLYHDGACTCATLANLTQKVGLPGRETFQSHRGGLSVMKNQTKLNNITGITPVAGLIFETKNRAIFLERFFWRDFSGTTLLPVHLFSQ